MALVEVTLGSSGSTTVDSGNANDGDTVNVLAGVNVASSQEIIIDGVDVSFGSVASIGALNSMTYTATGGADVTISSAALGVTLGKSNTYNINGDSSITLNTGGLNVDLFSSTNINFEGSGSGNLTILNNGSSLLIPSQKVGGFSYGDSVTLKTTSGDVYDRLAGGYDSGNGEYTLTYTNEGGLLDPSYRVVLTGISPEQAAALNSAVADGLTNGTFTLPVCFLKGTLIATDRGEVAIEKLQPGDKVVCKTGLREVKWIGYRREWAQRIPANKHKDVMPVRVTRDAIAQGVPSKDIDVSPWHHLWVDGVLVRAKDLINGSTIYQRSGMNKIAYYHVELDQFDIVLAHGIYSESWADGGNRDFFQNVDVTTLRPADSQRRLAARPGFTVEHDKTALAAIQARYAQRAAELIEAAESTESEPMVLAA